MLYFSHPCVSLPSSGCTSKRSVPLVTGEHPSQPQIIGMCSGGLFFVVTRQPDARYFEGTSTQRSKIVRSDLLWSAKLIPYYTIYIYIYIYYMFEYHHIFSNSIKVFAQKLQPSERCTCTTYIWQHLCPQPCEVSIWNPYQHLWIYQPRSRLSWKLLHMIQLMQRKWDEMGWCCWREHSRIVSVKMG